MNGDILQGGRNLTRDNALREPFNNSCFANPSLTGEDGVVLPPTHQHIYNLPNLSIATHDGVNLTRPHQVREIYRVKIQSARTCATARREWSVSTIGAPSTFSRTINNTRKVAAQPFNGHTRKARRKVT
jgi:hypothetical protein